MKIKKYLFVALGSLCVVLGAIGVFVPGLPTTPFLLLASWLFYRSSNRLRDKLLSSRLGKYVREYERNKGLTMAGKISAIAMMTVMSSVSIIFFIHVIWVKILVGLFALSGFFCVVFIVPTVKERHFDDDEITSQSDDNKKF